MNLKFDFFYDDNFINLNLNVNDKNCKDIIKQISTQYKKSIKNINIYENNNLLKNTFSNWNNNSNYIIFINNDFINIIIKCKSKVIKLPQLELNTTISDIKNILSIEGDIFFKNEKLDNKCTLLFYKIINNNILTTYQADVVTSTSTS
tara:strand:+ start:2226 stop:2669 length:444 start_codon:yes stop_codon:yes gene_type:complete